MKSIIEASKPEIIIAAKAIEIIAPIGSPNKAAREQLSAARVAEAAPLRRARELEEQPEAAKPAAPHHNLNQSPSRRYGPSRRGSARQRDSWREASTARERQKRD